MIDWLAVGDWLPIGDTRGGGDRAKGEETGEKEELDVEVGLEGTYYVEIKSDKLTEGMRVILPEIDTSNSIESLIEAMGADVGV